MKDYKPLFGLGIALLFVVIGYYLTSQEDQISQMIGYANIVFWSIFILFVTYKLTTKQKSK